MSRHQPKHGADSPEGRKPFSVLMENRWEEGDRIRVRIPAAYGPRDAKNQAQFDHPEYVSLDAVEEAERDHADAELQKAKDAA
jgi:hypothetical protein